MMRLVVAPTTAALRATSPANDGLLERTVATPMSAFSLTTRPPASAIAARAALPLAPCSYSTTYSRLGPVGAPSALAATPAKAHAASAANSTLRMFPSGNLAGRQPLPCPRLAADPSESVEEERPPVLHRAPLVVDRGVVETRHVSGAS